MYYGNLILDGKVIKNKKNMPILMEKWDYIAQDIMFSILLCKDIKTVFHKYKEDKSKFYSIVFQCISHIEDIVLKDVNVLGVNDNILFLELLIIYDDKSYILNTSSYL